MIVGINTTSDISKLLYAILKYHEWYLCRISRTNHAISCLYYYPQKRFVIFTCRYFKLSWNTTALSQSNCRDFSCSSIIDVICIGNSMNCSDIWHKYHLWYFKIISNFSPLTAHEISYKNFEISLVVFMPTITTNHAITYTNTMIYLHLKHICSYSLQLALWDVCDVN